LFHYQLPSFLAKEIKGAIFSKNKTWLQCLQNSIKNTINDSTLSNSRASALHMPLILLNGCNCGQGGKASRMQQFALNPRAAIKIMEILPCGC